MAKDKTYYSQPAETKIFYAKGWVQRYAREIERENLNLRNRLKRLNSKTLGYSKSPEMHDKVIGTFIEREHYLL